MADYIRSNILSQAYIHVEPQKINNPEELNAFREKIISFTKSRSEFYLYPGVDVNVEFEDGSLKARITIAGVFVLLYKGIQGYPDFREGVSLLYNDSKRLAEYIVSESQFLTGSRHNDVIRVESRTGILGSLHKITNALDSIIYGAEGGMTAKELAGRLEDLKEDIDKIINNIQSNDDKNLILAELVKLAKEIPEKPKDPIPPKKKNGAIALATYQDKRKALYKTLGIV